ncbi:hypothetical protein RCOM_1343880 [Ricinus communis]|uniref:DUF659 domain-containing protein n=1 Tax=Ricinus communis TaxID=3988 RepID=B9RN57_RICCO|nr:hypothetical protein RCOM_1343880 [Ricinus communis]
MSPKVHTLVIILTERALLRHTGHVNPGWEHGIAQDERNKNVICKYYAKIGSGGIFRLKQHLAGMSGEVICCDKVPEAASMTFQPNEFIDMGKAPGWEHCTGQDEKKNWDKMQLLRKIIRGSINQFKQHLASVPEEVAYCDKASEEVYLKIKENMKWHCTRSTSWKHETKEISAICMHQDDEDEEEEQEGGLMRLWCQNKKGRSPGCSSNSAETVLKRSKLDSVFLKSCRIQHHHTSKEMQSWISEKARKEVMSAICKFFCHAGITSNAANSPYFHKMLQLVGQYGKICKALQASVYFVSSFDVTEIKEDAASLFQLLEKVVDEVGERNVVQIIIKNTASFKTAGKMLKEKRKNLFWTPCAAHSIDRMLEDFLKKEFLNGQELLRPAIIKFGTTYLFTELPLRNVPSKQMGIFSIC